MQASTDSQNSLASARAAAESSGVEGFMPRPDLCNARARSVDWVKSSSIRHASYQFKKLSATESLNSFKILTNRSETTKAESRTMLTTDLLSRHEQARQTVRHHFRPPCNKIAAKLEGSRSASNEHERKQLHTQWHTQNHAKAALRQVNILKLSRTNLKQVDKYCMMKNIHRSASQFRLTEFNQK